jgi:rhamnose utilization protein RhaD (predicted bifunctional aldolase and dehydrogenase)
MANDGLEALVALSRRYGGDPSWVLAGGGNTSFKDGKRLWVKASGSPLAGIGREGFCEMDRARLDAIWSRKYPDETEARETAALGDLMAARSEGETRRPSVETLMHGFFPAAFVVHTHPTLVNGMTCGARGEALCRELFAEDAAWVPLVDPGYTLALTIKAAVEDFTRRRGRMPALLFMQNHGLLVAGETKEEIDRLSRDVVARLDSRLGRRPDRRIVAVDTGALALCLARLASLAAPGSLVAQRADADILAFAASKAAYAPIASAFSPDHIVYAGHEFLHAAGTEAIDAAWKDYRSRNGVDPRVVVVAGLGAFALGPTAAAAETALALFVDACAVAVYSESFGGPLHMAKARIDFIRTWEVERYRATTSLAKSGR